LWLGRIRDRAVRLGIPFLLSAAFLAPLAYYPTYLASSSATGTFWKQWLRLGAWPAGPAWFLWVLLVFGCLAAAIFAIDARFGDVLGRITGRLSTRPVIYFIVLVAMSALAYLPMAAKFDPLHWSRFGPFFVQTSRILQYALYFFAGIGAGVHGLGRGLLATDGRLARRWPLWVITSFVAFATLIASVIAIMSLFSKGATPPVALLTFANFAFVVACASLSLAALGIFSRFARNGNAIGDSLSANAYGIYLFHYAFVTWFQFALRNALRVREIQHSRNRRDRGKLASYRGSPAHARGPSAGQRNARQHFTQGGAPAISIACPDRPRLTVETLWLVWQESHQGVCTPACGRGAAAAAGRAQAQIEFSLG
jgi:hypothetical protein